jgi:hypothetical protein
MRISLDAALVAAGAALLVTSVAMHWFGVPDAPPSAPDAPLVVALREAPATLVFKALCLGALVAAGLLARRTADRRRVVAGLAAVLLLYPHAVMVWCPATAARAAWLEDQHTSLVWAGGDMWSGDEDKRFAWKGRVYVAPIAAEIRVVRTPAFEPVATPFGDIHDLLDWFGYSNPFCLFVRAGWAAALGGCVLMLAGLARGEGRAGRRALGDCVRAGCASAAIAGALALAPAAACAVVLALARSAASRGEYVKSLGLVRASTRLLPVLAANTDVVAEIGLLETRLGVKSLQADLYAARARAAVGDFDVADEIFTAIARDPRSPLVVRREAVRGLLQRGIRLLNSGETNAAAALLEAVLDADPCAVKANYALELAYLRAGRFASVEPLAARMRRVYGAFGTLTKMPVLGAVDENVADARYLSGDVAGAYAAWQLLSNPKALRSQP